MPTTTGDPAPVTPPDAWAEFWSSTFPRRLGVTLALLAVYRITALWPAAGIDLAAVYGTAARFDPLSTQLAEKLSPVALGLVPVFTVLIIMEFAKLALPTLKYWIDASAANRNAFNRRVLVAALLLAAFQGYGISVGLHEYDSSRGAMTPPLLSASGTSFTTIFIVSQVAGTALCMWIADQITRFGLGSGFWVLYSIPSLAGFALLPSMLTPLLENGALQAHVILVSAAVLIISVMAIATLVRQWMLYGPETVAAKTATANIAMTDAVSIVIWPPFLGVGIGGLLAGIVVSVASLFGSDATGSGVFKPGSLAMIALAMALIWLMTSLIASSVLMPAQRDAPDTRRLIQKTALVTSFTYAAMELLIWKWEMPSLVYGPAWIALVVILTLLVPSNVSRYVPVTEHLTDDDFSD